MRTYDDDYINKFGVRSEYDENKVLHSAKLKAYKRFDTSSFVDFYNVTLKTPIDESDITPVEKREFLMLVPSGEVLSNYTKYEIKNYSPSKQEWEIAVTLDKQELLNDFVNEAWFIEVPEGTNQNELKAKLKKQLREFDFGTVADKNHFITLVEISNYLNDYGYMFANECPLVLADVLDYNRYFSFLLEKISVLHKRINNSRAQWVLKSLMDEEVDAKFSFEHLTNDSNPENFKRYDIYFIKLLHFQVTEPAIQYHNKLLSAIGNAITAIFQPEALISTFDLAGYQIANDEIAEDFRTFFNTTKEQILRSFPRRYYSTITVTKEEIYEETL